MDWILLRKLVLLEHLAVQTATHKDARTKHILRDGLLLYCNALRHDWIAQNKVTKPLRQWLEIRTVRGFVSREKRNEEEEEDDEEEDENEEEEEEEEDNYLDTFNMCSQTLPAYMSSFHQTKSKW